FPSSKNNGADRSGKSPGTKLAAPVSIAEVKAIAPGGGDSGLESDKHAAFNELDGSVCGHHAPPDVGDFDCSGRRARPPLQRGQESIACVRGASGRGARCREARRYYFHRRAKQEKPYRRDGGHGTR